MLPAVRTFPSPSLMITQWKKIEHIDTRDRETILYFSQYWSLQHRAPTYIQSYQGLRVLVRVHMQTDQDQDSFFSFSSRTEFVCFTTLPLRRLPRYAHVLLKTPSENPVGKNDCWRKEYIAFVNCFAHVVSLKTLREEPSIKTHIRKKSTIFNLFGHVFFGIFYSS